MNEIIHKFLLAWDKFMPERHLRQAGFTYSVCGPITKNKERIQKFKETRDSRYIYQNELIKACFWLIEILRIYLGDQLVIKYYMIKHLTFLKIKSMIDINVELLQWILNFFIKSFQWMLLHMQANLVWKVTLCKTTHWLKN